MNFALASSLYSTTNDKIDLRKLTLGPKDIYEGDRDFSEA